MIFWIRIRIQIVFDTDIRYNEDLRYGLYISQISDIDQISYIYVYE
jgi:hypothetical protein